MKALLNGVMVMAITGLAVLCGVRYAAGQLNWFNGKEQTVMHSSPLMHELENIADLCTLRVPLSDVMDASREDRLRCVRGIWIVKGDALIGVDMTQAEVETNGVGRPTIVRLPLPSIKYARIDHERTKTYTIERGILTGSRWESELRDDAMRQAQRMIEIMAATPDNIRVAQAHAERVVKTFCAAHGVEVDIIWMHSKTIEEQQ